MTMRARCPNIPLYLKHAPQTAMTQLPSPFRNRPCFYTDDEVEKCAAAWKAMSPDERKSAASMSKSLLSGGYGMYASFRLKQARDNWMLPNIGPHGMDVIERVISGGPMVDSSRRKRQDTSHTYDDQGNRRKTSNGDIISETLSTAPAWSRQAPVFEDVTFGGQRYFAGVAAKEVYNDRMSKGMFSDGEYPIVVNCPIERVFTDFDTAWEAAPKLLGHDVAADGYTRSKTSLPTNYERRCAWLDRRNYADQAVIEAANRMMDVLDQELNMETLAAQLTPSPVGGSPRVGAFLAGSPNAMYRMEDHLDMRGPVRIFFDQSAIGGASSEALAARGAALLALTLAVQQIRPVELWATTQGTAGVVDPDSWGSYRSPITGEMVTGKAQVANTIFGCRVGSAPVDVDAAARAIGDRDTGTTFLYAMEMLIAGNRVGSSTYLGVNSLPFGVACGADEENDIVIRAISGANSIPSMLGWVKNELRKWLKKQGADNELVDALGS